MGIVTLLTLLLQGFTASQPPAPAPPPPPPPPPMPVMRAGPPCEAYWRAAAVFSGKLIDVTERRVAGRPHFVERSATFRVDRSWRGDVNGNVAVSMSPAPSPDDPTPGEDYLVYVGRYPMDQRFFLQARTRPLAEAADDLSYFARAQRPSPGATISGRVSFDAPDEEDRRPAAGYVVRLGNTEREWTAETNSQGRFEFGNVPAARYGIRVDAPEDLRVRGPAAIEIPDPRSCAEAEFLIASEGSVDFFVLDAKGKPAVRTTLELIDADTLDAAKPKVMKATTYADGSVGWAQVPSGRRYVIGLNVTRLPDGRQPQPILFYPGVTDVRSAHAFEIGPGERVQLDTFRLPDPPARLNVTGHIVRPDGTPIRGADVILRSAAKFTRGAQIGRSVKSDAEGGFTIPAIAGYRYFVEVLLSVEGQNARQYAISPEFLLTEKSGPLTISKSSR